MIFKKYIKLLGCIIGLVAVSQDSHAQAVKRITKPLRRPDPKRLLGSRPTGSFYPAMKWRLTLGMAENTTPAVADLDLDGAPDIVMTDARGGLYRLTGEGNVKWRVSLPETATAGVTLGDVDRDGTLDIVVAAGKYLLCFAPDGKERWRVMMGDTIASFPTIADLDADNKPEVIVGANDNKLHVLTGAGKPKWTFETKSWIVGGVAVSNLVGDKKLELVFGSMDYNVYCLDAEGKELWRHKTDNWVGTSPVIADIDRDGGRDILIASDDGFIYALSRRGTLKWKHHLFGVSEDNRTRAYLAVADLDGDGTLETIAVAPTGMIHVYTSSGELAWQSSAGGYNGSERVVGSPLIADLNGDGWQDILVATTEGNLVAFNTWGERYWSVRASRNIVATPLIADLNRDGKLEIYVGNLLQSGEGFFSRYELSVPGGKVRWATLKGDPYRTGEVSDALDYAAHLQRGVDYATAWEPFGAGYRPRAGAVPPRRLRITTLPLDDIEGNHDGALDPGETALFRVRVENLGRGASYDSLLTASFGARSPLKFDRPNAYLGWIAPGAAKTVTFRVTAPPLAKLVEFLQIQTTFREVAGGDQPGIEREELQPTKVRGRAKPIGAQIAQLQVFESGVQAAVSQSKVWDMPPLPPVLQSQHRVLFDQASNLTSGNGDGRLESGESAVLRVLLVNRNLTTAKRATVRLESLTSDVLVATPSTTLRDVVPFGGRGVAFSLRVARDLKGRTARLRLTTQADGAPAHVETYSYPLGQNFVDHEAPQITLSSPQTRIATTNASRMMIVGEVSDTSGISNLRFDGFAVPLTRLRHVGPNRYRFAFMRPLKVGENVFPLSVSDVPGNTLLLPLRIVRRPIAPGTVAPLSLKPVLPSKASKSKRRRLHSAAR